MAGGLQRRDLAWYPSRMLRMVVGAVEMLGMLVLVGVRMRMRMRMGVGVRMLVHGGHGPRMRMKIASRVVVQPEEAITGNINIGHGVRKYLLKEEEEGRREDEEIRKITADGRRLRSSK